MILRRNFVPKALKDITCSSLLLFVFIPYVYWFELYVVVPYYHEFGSFWYNFWWITGTFVGFNIVTNLVALILCDTSVKGKVMPTEMKPGFIFCSVCESVVPPRSWHCHICKTCILKRDHHCVFSGCCVGLENYRYFCMLVFYLFIALVMSTTYNTCYVWQVIDFQKISWIHVLFPLAMLAFEYTHQQFILLVYILLAVATVFCGILCYLHFCLVRDGQVMHERSLQNRIYDMGLMNNIHGALGVKWYKIWICPFLKSELTVDGINWKVNESDKSK